MTSPSRRRGLVLACCEFSHSRGGGVSESRVKGSAGGGDATDFSSFCHWYAKGGGKRREERGTQRGCSSPNDRLWNRSGAESQGRRRKGSAEGPIALSLTRNGPVVGRITRRMTTKKSG